MSALELIEEYLAKAKEAEEQALRCPDGELKESWEKMAASYREMAQYQLDRNIADVAPHQPPQMPTSPTNKAQ